MVIDNQVADATWGTGKKKVEYSAMMKAVEPELTVYFYEILKESSSGFSFGTVEAESYTISGTTRSGKQSMVIMGPTGVATNWEWDYGDTRRVVEDVVTRHGWKLKTVLQKKSAQW